MSKLGKRLIEAAKEARAIARRETDAASFRLHLPDDIEAQSMRQEPAPMDDDRVPGGTRCRS